jgi:hypothetical protein
MRSKEISMELTNTLLTSLENTRVEVFSTRPLLSKLSSGTGTNQANGTMSEDEISTEYSFTLSCTSTQQ